MTNQKRTLLSICLLVLFMITVVACTKEPITKVDPNENDAEKASLSLNAPLTGVAQKTALDQRPVMVMVENSPSARPQSGLVSADLVYEILAEGDVTRFLSVFQSDESPEMVGPVRSLRPYFAEIGAGLDAFIVHAGWSPEAMQVILDKDLDHFDDVCGVNLPKCKGDGKYYWRDNSRKMPHNLYTNIQKIREGAVDKNLRTSWINPGLLFLNNPNVPTEVTPTPFANVKINYFNGYYVDYAVTEDNNLMERSMIGTVHADRETGESVKVSNVLICFTGHLTLDKEGRRAVDINGPGKGYLLQNGTYVEVTWKNENGAIRAFIDGTELGFMKGKTWIQIVPENAKIEWS